jgi:hypothetical protein
MTNYILHNRHTAEECEGIFVEGAERLWPARTRGTIAYCACPSGEHWAVLSVEAESPEEALSLLGPRFRAGTTAVAGAVVTIGEAPFAVAEEK